MLDNIRIRLITVSIGLTTLIFSFIFNAASSVIINAIILLSLFLFISIPYYFNLMKNIGYKYNFYIAINYLLFLIFLIIIKFELFIITLIFLLISIFANYLMIAKRKSSIEVDDYYSPVHFAIKNYREMNYLLNILILISLFYCFFLFTTLFKL